MKKLLFVIASAGFLFTYTSCTDAGGMSAAAKKNLEANRAITKSFETKDFSKLGDYIDENCVDHAGENGDIVGLENMKAEFARMVEGIEDSKTEVIKELADDEYVMAWMRFTGKLKMDMMGMKAGDSYDMTAIELSKFKDGKAIEHWTFMQPSDMMNMMSPPPAPATEKN